MNTDLTDDLNLDSIGDMKADPTDNLPADLPGNVTDDLGTQLTEDLSVHRIDDVATERPDDLADNVTANLATNYADALPSRLQTNELAGQLDGDRLARVSIDADNSSSRARDEEDLHPDIKNALLNSKARSTNAQSDASATLDENKTESQNRSFFSALDSIDETDPAVASQEDASAAELAAEQPAQPAKSRQIEHSSEHPSLLYRALGEPRDGETERLNSSAAASADDAIANATDAATDLASASIGNEATKPLRAESDNTRQHTSELTAASRAAQLESRMLRAERSTTDEREAREAAESLIASQRQLIEELRLDISRYTDKINTLEASQRTQLDQTEYKAATDSHSKLLADAAVEGRRAAEAEAARERLARQKQEAATKRAVAIARNAIEALAERERKATGR